MMNENGWPCNEPPDGWLNHLSTAAQGWECADKVRATEAPRRQGPSKQKDTRVNTK